MNIPFGDSLVSWRDFTYTKIGNLGEGGSSAVFSVVATSGPYRGVPFAAKVFQSLSKEEWRLNFMREVNFLRSCDHPAVLRIFDEGVHQEGYPFVVMELLPNTLGSLMRTGTLGEIEKLAFLTQLLSALNYLSRLDPPVVHRDIKPSNIFIKAPSCVLGDFGLVLPLFDSASAVAPEAKATALAVPQMARNYRTPELVVYHNGGPKPPPESDIFQLGLVAAELFTGANPLLPGKPESPLAMQPVGDVTGPLGEPIRGLINKMLTAEVEKRPTAAALVNQWQEIYIEAIRRAHAQRRAERLAQQSPQS